MSSDTSHTVCPVKAANPGAHDQWYVDEGTRCVRVTKAYVQTIRVADAHYPTRLVRGALDKLRTEGPARVRNPYKALAHVVMEALGQLAVDAGMATDLLFLARPRFWRHLCEREVDSTKTKKVLCTFSECPEGDTVTNFASKYNGERCKHHGESLDVPEPASFLLHSAFPLTCLRTPEQQQRWVDFVEEEHPESHYGALDIAARQVGCRSSSSTVNGRSYRSCLGVRQGELEVFDCVLEVLFTAALSLGVEVGFFVCLGHSVTQDRVRSIARRVQVIHSPNTITQFAPLPPAMLTDKNVGLANHWYVPPRAFLRAFLPTRLFSLTVPPST